MSNIIDRTNKLIDFMKRDHKKDKNISKEKEEKVQEI